MTIDRSYTDNSCNNSKCYVCNFRFVCASSPYCLLQGNSVQNIKDIQDFKKEVSDLVNSQMNLVSSLLDKFNNVSSSIASVEESVLNLKKSMDDVSTKIQDQSLQTVLNTDDFNSVNQIVPFESNNEEKVMVEKKGLFGKTKWVEKKK